MVQNIGNTWQAGVLIICRMPWKRIEPMNQRKEFVLKAIHTSNFSQLCEEYEISTKTVYKWRGPFLQIWAGGDDGAFPPAAEPCQRAWRGGDLRDHSS